MRYRLVQSLACLLPIVLLWCCRAAPAQTFDLDSEREPITSLNGLWRFHPGDDMRWAEREFDDSQWVKLRSDRSWTKQGYPNLGGYAWYRFQLRVTNGSRPTAIMFGTICTGYEVYIDGKLIGSFGSSFPTRNPKAPWRRDRPLMLPSKDVGRETVQVAVRVWDYPPFVPWIGGGVLSARNFAGDPAVLDKQSDLLQTNTNIHFANRYAFVLLESLVGFTVLALFYFRREDREYLWFSILLLAGATDLFLNLLLNLTEVSFPLVRLAGETAAGLELLAALLFFSTILQSSRQFFWWFSFLTTAVSPLTVGLFYFHWTKIGSAYLILLMCRSAGYLWIASTLSAACVRRDPSAQLLLAPSLLFYGSDILDLISFANRQYGRPLRLVDFNPLLLKTPYPFELDDLTAYFFILALLLYLVRRFSLARREESRLTTEMDAARDIQFLSVPGAAQNTPGFEVDSAYFPATEVGGDFFRIGALQDGSLLVIVGDVSGKGLKAAMTVSSIIGALRGCTLRSPAAVLAFLNRVLLGEISGFVTCCVALISTDGTMTLANAGHLPPYLAGEELPLQSGLPLGISDGELYENKDYKVGMHEQLMFVSDGVVEACNKSGELYGFDRTLKSSLQSADLVAHAARRFGQNDDITVVAIKRTPVINVG